MKRKTKYQRVCKRCDNLFKSETKYRSICDNCNMSSRMNTKKYRDSQAKKQLKLKDKAWSIEIRKDPCLICGTFEKLHAHHLIPREIKETRHLYENGVSVCAKHHKYCYYVSFHKNAASALLILRQKNPTQYEWLMNTLISLKLKYPEKYEYKN